MSSSSREQDHGPVDHQQQQEHPEVGLLSLPVELLHQVMSLLPLSSIYHLGSVNKHLHRVIHQDDRLWRFKVRQSRRLRMWDREEEECQEESVGQYPDDDSDLLGLLRDPTIQGHKELFLMYSDEFADFLRLHREQKQTKLERMIRSFIPRFLPPKSSYLPDAEESTRLALFGPGIESPNTKHLVHKVVNSHNNVFDAVNSIPGQTGGFGSGVRIDFRKLQTFDLICLYSNSARIRETLQGGDRLRAENNKLLSASANEGEEEDGFQLHDSVLKLLPTAQALIYAVDATELSDAALAADAREEQLRCCRLELRLMVRGLGARDRHTPVLVLACHRVKKKTDQGIGLGLLAESLGLTDSSWSARPWAVFEVEIEDMEGMARALDWALYHCQKRRSSLEYHKSQSEKLM